MTTLSLPPGGPPLTAAPLFDLERVLASIDTMAAQRPVAAQVVAHTNAPEVGATDLARVLGADVALSGRVMRLANSAYYGMRGRVGSLRFAVTVVGFATVRTMATVALTALEDQSRLPADFWRVSTSLALSASSLAPRFGERPQDALCTGLLTQLGVALLHQDDPDGYAELVAAEPTVLGRRSAEVRRYGIHAPRLTAVALEQWGFPHSMLTPLRQIDDPASVDGGLLRGAMELTARLTSAGHTDEPVERLTCGRLREDDVPSVLEQVTADVDELYAALLG